MESFGRFNRVLKPGFNGINVCTEEVFTISLKIKLLNIPKQATNTKDNVKLTVDATLAYRISNPVITHYVLGGNVETALSEQGMASIREIVGEKTLDEVLTSRSEINDQAKETVRLRSPPGIEIEGIFIEDLIVPQSIRGDLSAAARQRRLGEASIINSQADVETASLLKQKAELLDTKAAMQIRYLEMVQ